MSEPKHIEKIASEAELAQLCGLGRFLEENRSSVKIQSWRKRMYIFLALLVVLNFVVANVHPHFVYDVYPGFWPVVSFVVGVVMIFFVKRIVQPVIKRPEDYYGDI